jgi:hypothetical protein
LVVVCPFGYVEEPFGGVGVFEKVAELKRSSKSNLGGKFGLIESKIY